MKKLKLNKRNLQMMIIAGAVLITGVLIMCIVISMGKWHKNKDMPVRAKLSAPAIDERLLTPNEYSRPQLPLKSVRGIVVHYTANPGTDADDNRNYFENLRTSKTTYVSSHFIIGLKGDIIQCIPLDEVAYASNERNKDTLSIECCHKNKNGKFTKETYNSLVKLTAWLCSEYKLDTDDIIRHYDVTGKACPLYFVEHEDKWQEFLKDVEDELYNNQGKQ